MAHYSVVAFIFLPGLQALTVPFLCYVLLPLDFPGSVPFLPFFALLHNINNTYKIIFELYLQVFQLNANVKYLTKCVSYLVYYLLP